jgi:hypothetical protein
LPFWRRERKGVPDWRFNKGRDWEIADVAETKKTKRIKEQGVEAGRLSIAKLKVFQTPDG